MAHGTRETGCRSSFRVGSCQTKLILYGTTSRVSDNTDITQLNHRTIGQVQRVHLMVIEHDFVLAITFDGEEDTGPLLLRSRVRRFSSSVSCVGHVLIRSAKRARPTHRVVGQTADEVVVDQQLDAVLQIAAYHAVLEMQLTAAGEVDARREEGVQLTGVMQAAVDAVTPCAPRLLGAVPAAAGAPAGGQLKLLTGKVLALRSGVAAGGGEHTTLRGALQVLSGGTADAGALVLGPVCGGVRATHTAERLRRTGQQRVALHAHLRLQQLTAAGARAVHARRVRPLVVVRGARFTPGAVGAAGQTPGALIARGARRAGSGAAVAVGVCRTALAGGGARLLRVVAARAERRTQRRVRGAQHLYVAHQRAVALLLSTGGDAATETPGEQVDACTQRYAHAHVLEVGGAHQLRGEALLGQGALAVHQETEAGQRVEAVGAVAHLELEAHQAVLLRVHHVGQVAAAGGARHAQQLVAAGRRHPVALQFRLQRPVVHEEAAAHRVLARLRVLAAGAVLAQVAARRTAEGGQRAGPLLGRRNALAVVTARRLLARQVLQRLHAVGGALAHRLPVVVRHRAERAGVQAGPLELVGAGRVLGLHRLDGTRVADAGARVTAKVHRGAALPRRAVEGLAAGRATGVVYLQAVARSCGRVGQQRVAHHVAEIHVETAQILLTRKGEQRLAGAVEAGVVAVLVGTHTQEELVSVAVVDRAEHVRARRVTYRAQVVDHHRWRVHVRMRPVLGAEAAAVHRALGAARRGVRALAALQAAGGALLTRRRVLLAGSALIGTLAGGVVTRRTRRTGLGAGSCGAAWCARCAGHAAAQLRAHARETQAVQAEAVVAAAVARLIPMEGPLDLVAAGPQVELCALHAGVFHLPGSAGDRQRDPRAHHVEAGLAGLLAHQRVVELERARLLERDVEREPRVHAVPVSDAAVTEGAQEAPAGRAAVALAAGAHAVGELLEPPVDQLAHGVRAGRTRLAKVGTRLGAVVTGRTLHAAAALQREARLTGRTGHTILGGQLLRRAGTHLRLDIAVGERTHAVVLAGAVDGLAIVGAARRARLAVR
mmetsp:Transcript_15248/g.38778  ORF Transcript_15248/g.38778 Transcript_15248/m.38778 type:complete len:1059 (+) Transcript_15248:1602-4778(+)